MAAAANDDMDSVHGSRSIVLAWGSGEDGQLGMGNWEEKDWVDSIKSLESINATQVVGGSRNSLAICQNGNLYTWGWNQRGTLGHPPETKTESVPSLVKELVGVKIVQAAIGGWHCLAVDDQGRAYAWGGNEYGQCGEEPERKELGRALRRDIVIPQRCVPRLTVRQVAAGGTHSVVLTTDGHIWSWGQPWPPGDIKQISTPVKVQGLEQVRLISVGAFHNLALEEGGELWAWGNNEYGQLGTGDTQPSSQPILVQGLDGLTLVDIAAGGWHSTAITDNGEVYAWGRGEHGRLGFGDDKSSKMVPQKVQLLAGENISQVSCGGTHSVARTHDGRMFSVKVTIKGRVQGVFFRDWTVENAQELGLDGWVRNRLDGSVEAVFSGKPDKVDEMVNRRCCVGPPAAIVTAISCSPSHEQPVAGAGFQSKPTF